MSEARIALAPIAAISIHDGVDVPPRHQRPHRDPGRVGQRRDGGDSRPGVTAVASSSTRARAVVVQHQVLLAEHHTLHAARPTGHGQRPFAMARRRSRRVRSAPPRNHTTARRKPTRSCSPSVRPDPTTSAIASATPSCTEISTAPSSRITVASIPLAARSFRTRLGNAVAIRLPARSSTASPPGRSGVTERRRPESQRQPLAHRRVGFRSEIAPGDAEVELARADVDRDVLGPQEEELDLVGRIDDGQILGVGAAAVPGLGQDLGGGLAERALVGYGDPQHGRSQLLGRRRRG